MGNLEINRNTQVCTRHWKVFERPCSRRMRELATRDLLDKFIVGQVHCRTNSGGVSDRIIVGNAEINSIFVYY